MQHLKQFENFNWDEVYRSNRGEDENRKWNNLEMDVKRLVDKYQGQFGLDSYGVVDAIHQVLEGLFQKR